MEGRDVHFIFSTKPADTNKGVFIFLLIILKEGVRDGLSRSGRKVSCTIYCTLVIGEGSSNYLQRPFFHFDWLTWKEMLTYWLLRCSFGRVFVSGEKKS